MIRPITKNNYSQLKQIHERFYKDEFEFPDFLTHFINAFLICNKDDEVVSVVGIRNILECVVLTDKSKSSRDKYATLIEGLDAIKVVTSMQGFNEVHAFVQDEHWLRVLNRFGFKSCKGQALVLSI